MASKGKVLQGNHPQGLVAHLPTAKPHKKLRGSKPQLMRKGDKFLVKGRVLHIPRLQGKSEHRVVSERYENNDLDLDEVMRVIGKDGAVWPDIPGKISKNILNKEAWMWMNLAALMKGMTISLPAVMATAMNDDPTKSKRQLLPFPMFITKWAEEAGIPTYQGDEIFNVPKALQFFPYGLWKDGREVDEDPIPPPMTAPAPPPATRTDIPAPPTHNSPQSSMKEA
ncbi:hypothetical protein PIB30_092720 [Stylosanthes scabra]|uniref:Uncharacterized protein n=1 Tax=Stylosanthes scabra TaxID=79078 RepID=A0ABU6XU28_9FABA|nr:hypothetical protein [Stylosanthes scabra]